MADQSSHWIADAWTSIVVLGATSFGGGVLWLIRRVFTNQKQIDLILNQEIARDVIRKQDRDAMKEIHKDVRELRSEISEWRK